MGLDQSVHKRSKTNENDMTEIAYWRKENTLQGWFEDNYNIENCGEVILTEGIVNMLLADIKAAKLKPAHGVFYGSQDELPEDWYKEMYEEWHSILGKMKLDSGYEFYYTCWY